MVRDVEQEAVYTLKEFVNINNLRNEFLRYFGNMSYKDVIAEVGSKEAIECLLDSHFFNEYVLVDMQNDKVLMIELASYPKN